jgi:hypothetical protein
MCANMIVVFLAGGGQTNDQVTGDQQVNNGSGMEERAYWVRRLPEESQFAGRQALRGRWSCYLSNWGMHRQS